MSFKCHRNSSLPMRLKYYLKEASSITLLHFNSLIEQKWFGYVLLSLHIYITQSLHLGLLRSGDIPNNIFVINTGMSLATKESIDVLQTLLELLPVKQPTDVSHSPALEGVEWYNSRYRGLFRNLVLKCSISQNPLKMWERSSYDSSMMQT